MKKPNIGLSILDAIRSHARFIAKRDGLPRHAALKQAAVAMGFQNYRHALNHHRSGSPVHRVFITAYWIDGYDRGRETLAVDLDVPLTSLVTAAVLRRKNSLRPFRLAGFDHIVRREPTRSQHSARERLCHVARVLQFMQGTGLRPADGAWRKALPGVPINKPLPGADHSSLWVDPETGRYLFIDEPYGRAAPMTKLTDREAWAAEFGFDIAESPWHGMYFPEGGSRMFFVSSRQKGVPLAPLVAASRAMDAPITFDPTAPDKWAGVSAAYRPIFVSPGQQAARAARPPRTTPANRRAPGPRVTTPYAQMFVGRQRRPKARMPIEAHEEVSKLLNNVRAACIYRSGVANRLDRVRSELDEWIQREYTHGELPQERFFRMYYPSDTPDPVGKAISRSQAATFVSQLQSAREKMSTYYPDCKPLRMLLRAIDGAARSLEQWVVRTGGASTDGLQMI